MEIGAFRLEQHVGGDPRLVEISQLEYEALAKTFIGERILRGPTVDFLGASWSLVLGTIDSQVYKLSTQFVADSFEATEDVYLSALMFCSSQFGRPSSNEKEPFTAWDTTFGNVIVDRVSLFGQFAVNIQATSASVINSTHRLSK